MLATVDGYKVYAGIPVGYTTADAVIAGLIARVEDQAGRYCNRVFELNSVAVQETYNGGSCSIQLKRYPVIEIEDVAYLSDVFSGAIAFTPIDADNYYADAQTGLLFYRNGVFPEGVRNIRVKYRGGWDSTTVPGEFLQSVYQAVDWYYADRRMNQSLASESVGSANVNRKSESEVRELMDRLFGGFRTGGLT